VNGRVSVGVVDCYDAKKTCAAIEDLGATHIEFVCATHPHFDHTKGIQLFGG
jgi:glyoxylase-like metal-dependent hydrolase (beta-lactamase superfamily II)